MKPSTKSAPKPKATTKATTKAATKAATKPKATAKASVSKGKGKAVESDSDDSFNSSESESEAASKPNQAAMLAALEAHSRAMLGFGWAGGGDKNEDEDEDEDDDDDSTGNGPMMIEESDDEGFHTDDGWGAEDGFVTDSEDEMGAIDAAFMSGKKGKKSKPAAENSAAPTKPVAAKPAAPSVPEVVFAPGSSSSSAMMVSKSEKRAFMKGNSAKMMGIQAEVELSKRGKKRARDQAEEEEEASNLRLDQTLHNMLLTSLLPGAEADSAARPVEKRNALSGRLLELASYSLPGEGSTKVRGASLWSHPANVRTGLMHAAARREEKARAESEAAGSWVKGIGGLGDMGKGGAGIRPSGGNAARGLRTFGLEVGKKKGMSGKKNERAKGLSMGVGNYKNGTLTISDREIDRVNNLGKGGMRKKGGKKRK